MITATSVPSAIPITVAASQSNVLLSLVSKVALGALATLASSFYVPSSWVPIVVFSIIGISIALTLFPSIESCSCFSYQGHYPSRVYRPIVYRPVEICRPPVRYPTYRPSFPPIRHKHPLQPTCFQPRRDRVGERTSLRRQ